MTDAPAPAGRLDPRKDIQDLLAAVVTLAGAQVQESPESYLADDGLTERAQHLIAAGQNAMVAIEVLAQFFGCQMLPKEQRQVPADPNLHPATHLVLRRILQEG